MMRHKLISKPVSTGFSLVEMLVATTIGLILLSGMFAVFAGNHRSSSLNTELANMQESIRFALNAIGDDVRMAGYQGCMDLNGGTVDIIANDPPSDNLRSTVISGSVIQNNGNWSPTPEVGTGPNQFTPPDTVTPRIGTHTLAVQFAETPGSSLRGPQMVGGLPDSSGVLQLENHINVEVGDLALVSTCEAGEIFRVSQITDAAGGGIDLGHDGSVNTRGNFKRTYGVPANIDQTRVLPFSTRVYFVADTGEDKADGSSLFALYQQTMPFDEDENPPVKLVEGVENMRILFGIGSANGQLQYVSADDSEYDPTQIRNVRLGLLMSSYDALLDEDDTNTYRLVDVTLSRSATDGSAGFYADDKRLRLSFNTTVSVRNRRAQ